MVGDLSVEVHVEEVPVGLVVRPPDPSDVTILYLHGDRNLAGSAEGALDTAGRIASRTGAAVLCPRFEPVYPTALDDVQIAYRYCQDWGPIVVAGERLGATLTAALLLGLRDVEAPLPRCGLLLSGLLDLTMDARSLQLNAWAEPGFDIDELRRGAARYAAGGDLTDPLLSPLHGNLHGLPPIQLLAAGTDPLLDDSLAFAARAARSGVTVDLQVWPEAVDLRREAIPAMTGFIQAWTPAGQTSRPA